MTLKFIHNKKLLFVIGFALFIRSMVLILSDPWGSDPVFLDDDQGYALMGEYIVENGNFNYNNVTDVYSSFRTPGYPLFIAVIYLIFGKILWAIPLMQVLLDTATVFITYLISFELFGSERPALIGALLYSVNFPSIFFTQIVMTDILFVFLFSLSILFFIRAVQKNIILTYLISALFLGMCANIRPIVLYFPIVILIVMLYAQGKLIKKVILFTLFLITFLLSLLPWQLRNLNTFGHFKMTSQSGYSIYNFNIAIAEADLYNKTTKEIRDEHMSKVDTISNPFEKSEAFDKLSINFLLEHPVVYLKYHVIGVLKMFLATSKSFFFELFNIEYESDNSNQTIFERIVSNIYSPEQLFLTPILTSVNVLIYTLAFWGIYKMYGSNYREVLLLIIIILYFVNITSVVGNLQYKIPITPFYLILTALGIEKLLESRRFLLKKIM